jgi:sucrose-6-phosphate hydrolase SacC (GH32 family)
MKILAFAFAIVVALSPSSGIGDEPLRPRYHFTPPQNFMNDPNGLVFLDGEYHLFYQHNPQGEKWGHMSWGHAVSRDLLHWQHLPLALAEENGIMIFSGSAVADPANTSGLCGAAAASCLIAIYTGHTEERQTQNLAVSVDRGRTWRKFEGNPVVDLSRRDNRDPKVFWYEPSQRWIMVTVLAGSRRVRFFSSKDLKHWDVLSDFGPEGATGGAWECPDLFELPVEGGAPGETRWVLDVDLNPGGRLGGSGGQYFVGRFDGRRFTNENPDDLTLWVDYGRDFYASQSYDGIARDDGRRIWIGWMADWLYANEEPTSPWRGVQSFPRALALRRTPSGIRLVQTPIREIGALRSTAEPQQIVGRSPLPGAADLEFDVAPGDWTVAGVRLSNAAGEQVAIGVQAEPLEVFVDRRKSRIAPFHDAYPERHAGPVRLVNGHVALRVLFDRTTIEVFANGGERVISDRVYPTQPFTHIEPLHTSGAASPIRLWELSK